MAGFLSAIRDGLKKSRDALSRELKMVLGGGTLTEEMLEELEESLIRADVGVGPALKMSDALRDRALGRPIDRKEARALLVEVASEMLPDRREVELAKPLHVVLVVGVNGAGKTTTIGKLAKRYVERGLKTMLAAGDTFRAAAIEQLDEWAKRAGADIVKHHLGSDSAAVAFDAYNAAVARGCDVLLVDTAGRLHNKANLMEELAKITRILRKNDPSLPHETLLVVDGATGQNAVAQIKSFNRDVPLTGLVVTKLDGSSRGGAVLAMAHELGLPIQWVGVGEGIDDLVPFSKKEYVEGLFPAEDEA